MPQDIDDPDLPLAEMFRTWPVTASVFVERGMLCAGCPISPFHTLVDACREYHLDKESFCAELRWIIAAERGADPHG